MFKDMQKEGSWVSRLRSLARLYMLSCFLDLYINDYKFYLFLNSLKNTIHEGLYCFKNSNDDVPILIA